jgi:plasmid stabilization system protein ParE
MKVRYSNLALVELDAILANIQAENPDAAASFQARVRRVVERIGQFPESAQEACSPDGAKRNPG